MTTDIDVMFSSNSHEWETPDDLFDILNKEFEFTLDVCATEKNAKVANYISPQQDAFSREFKGVCWMNPPYGRQIGNWIQRAYEQAYNGNCTIVCLVPARTDTQWWWNYARHGEVRFIKGRLRFKGGDSGAPFPSAVIIFRRNHRPWMANTIYWTPDQP